MHPLENRKEGGVRGEEETYCCNFIWVRNLVFVGAPVKNWMIYQFCLTIFYPFYVL